MKELEDTIAPFVGEVVTVKALDPTASPLHAWSTNNRRYSQPNPGTFTGVLQPDVQPSYGEVLFTLQTSQHRILRNDITVKCQASLMDAVTGGRTADIQFPEVA